MRKLLCLVVSVLMAACGGGGHEIETPGSTSPTSVPSASMSGTMNVISVVVLTPSPNTLQAMDLQVDASFTGSVSSGATHFDIPVVVLSAFRLGVAMEGAVSFSLVSGNASSGHWSGRGVVSLPPQPVGDHVFSAGLRPESVFNFTGSSNSAVTGTVRVLPPNPP